MMKRKCFNFGLLLILLAILSFSCKFADKRINSINDSIEILKNENLDKNVNNQEGTKDLYLNLTKVDLNSRPQELLSFPLAWERFGIEKGDTVTYRFCYASNPEFTISNDFELIQIIIGNELHQTFKISSIYYNDAIFKFILEPNNEGINDCVFKWNDKDELIGTLILYGKEDSFNYLPKSKLVNKRRLEEECD